MSGEIQCEMAKSTKISEFADAILCNLRPDAISPIMTTEAHIVTGSAKQLYHRNLIRYFMHPPQFHKFQNLDLFANTNCKAGHGDNMSGERSGR